MLAKNITNFKQSTTKQHNQIASF